MSLFLEKFVFLLIPGKVFHCPILARCVPFGNRAQTRPQACSISTTGMDMKMRMLCTVLNEMDQLDGILPLKQICPPVTCNAHVDGKEFLMEHERFAG